MLEMGTVDYRVLGDITVVRRGSVRRAKLYYLRDRRGKSVRIAASTSPYERMIGTEFEITGRYSEQVLKSRQMLAINDGSSDTRIHERIRAHVRVGSIVYIPLFHSDGGPLGLLMLRPFMPWGG